MRDVRNAWSTGAVAKNCMVSFIQPRDVVSENELKRTGFGTRGRAIGVFKQLAAWKDIARDCALLPIDCGLRDVPCTVQVTIQFNVVRRRDPHNYVGTVVKSCVDGLVQGGLWPDDTPEWVTVLEPLLEINRMTVLQGSIAITARG